MSARIPPLAGLFGYDEVAAELAGRSLQDEWWPEFVAAMRAGAPSVA